MANNVPCYVTVDWKNTTGMLSIVAILGLLILFIFLPGLIQKNKLSKYKGEAVGTVTLVTENMEIDQGLEGTKIYVGSYSVNYYYQVDGQTYNKRERVKATPNATRIINRVTTSSSKHLVVRYDELSPNHSTILID